MHRGIGAPGSGSQPSLHAPLGMSRSVPNLSPSFAVQTSAIGGPEIFGNGGIQGSAFQASLPPTISPHIITVPVGEDIASKIISFSQQGPRAVYILSANGAVSTVTLRQSATSSLSPI